VDEAVYQTIKDVINHKFTPGVKIYDLKSNGVGLSDMRYTKDKIGVANLAKVEAIKQQIILGSIVVPANEDQLKEFFSKSKSLSH